MIQDGGYSEEDLAILYALLRAAEERKEMLIANNISGS